MMSTSKDMKRFNALVEVAHQKTLELEEEEEAAKRKLVRKNESHATKRRNRNSITSSDREDEEEAETKKRVRNNESHAKKRHRTSITSSHREEEEKYSPKKSKKLTKKRNVKKHMNNGPQPPTPLPERFRQAMEKIAEGRNIMEIKLVLQKGLYNTDLSKGQNRLSIPFKQIISRDFLREEEQVFLTTRDQQDKMNFKKVTLIEPSLEKVRVKLCRWDMRKENGNTSSSYVINGKWGDIVERNKLVAGMVLQLWAFRIEEKLYLALVNLDSR